MFESSLYVPDPILFPSLHYFCFLGRLALWSWRKAKDSRSYYSSSPPTAHVKTLHTARTFQVSSPGPH